MSVVKAEPGYVTVDPSVARHFTKRAIKRKVAQENAAIKAVKRLMEPTKPGYEVCVSISNGMEYVGRDEEGRKMYGTAPGKVVKFEAKVVKIRR